MFIILKNVSIKTVIYVMMIFYPDEPFLKNFVKFSVCFMLNMLYFKVNLNDNFWHGLAISNLIKIMK
jgi:hypothetical protein